MAYGIGGGGFVGIALEVTPNTYVAPVKFFPIRSESLAYMQDTQWRRTIRANVDNMGGVPGNVHVAGDIEMEALADTAIFFHRTTRAGCVKSGTTPNFIYTFTPTPDATAGKTASITIVRNGITFGYVGCVVSSFKYSVDNGQLIATYSIIGSDEASQTLPTPVYTINQQPFGAGNWTIEIPTATVVFDVDTFEFTVEDNAEPQFRLKSPGRGAQFVKYGERSATCSVERDFQTRTDFDAYKALTAQAIRILADKGVGPAKIDLNMPAAIKDTYELGLSGQGDLIRASINYQATFDFTTQRAYQLIITTAEDLTVP